MKEFRNVSIRGRVAYMLCALEKLLLYHQDKRDDWAWILEKFWAYTDAEWLDEWQDVAVEFLPECILEDGSEEFERLSAGEYDKLHAFYEETSEDIREMMELVFDVATVELYGGIPEGSPETLKVMEKAKAIFDQAGLTMPDPKPFAQYRFSEERGWGRRFDSRNLSRFL